MNRETMTEAGKPSSRLLKFGIIGTIIFALGCFTPALVVLFGAIGLSALVGSLDLVLYPALGFFVLLTFYAVWRRHRIMQGAEEMNT